MKRFGGHSMAAPLRRVIVCQPKVAGWDQPSDWEKLGYFHQPEPSLAEAQHDGLIGALEKAECEIVFLESAAGLSLDAVYAHDASIMTNEGAICMHMGKPNRRAEPEAHQEIYASLGIPILGTIEPPGLTEAGDMVWLDDRSLLIGEGFRTNAEGIRQMQDLLKPFDIEVLTAPLPYGPGPEACLHLMFAHECFGRKAGSHRQAMVERWDARASRAEGVFVRSHGVQRTRPDGLQCSRPWRQKTSCNRGE